MTITAYWCYQLRLIFTVVDYKIYFHRYVLTIYSDRRLQDMGHIGAALSEERKPSDTDNCRFITMKRITRHVRRRFTSFAQNNS
jgi:hypothetical protein